MAEKIFAFLTLIAGGVIIADLVGHADGVKAAGSALNNILVTSFTAMLGSVPKNA